MDAIVTKLPSSVSNEKLFKMDELHFVVKIPEGSSLYSRKFTCSNGGFGKISMRIVGNGSFVNSSDVSIGKTIEYTAGQDCYLSTGEYDLFIGSKYNMGNYNFNSVLAERIFADTSSFKCLPVCTQLWIGKVGGMSDDGKLNIDDVDVSFVKNFLGDASKGSSTMKGSLKHFDNVAMTRLSFASQKIGGEIKDISSLANIETVDFGYTDVSGDIKDFGSSKLISVNVKGTSVGGTLESLLSKMVSAGRNSGSCTFLLQESNVTYKGSVPTSNIVINFPLA